MESVLEK